MKIKSSISDLKFKDLLIDAINKGSELCTNKTNFYELLRTNYKISKERSLKLYDLYYSEIIRERNNAKQEYGIEKEKEAVKNALYYREKILQKMEDIIDQKAKKVEGQIIMPTFSDTIRASERIAKILGIDAPVRSDITTQGEKVNNVDLSNVPTSLLLELEKHLK